MARKKFQTPPTLPETTQCRGLVIPASKEWLGLYSDALLDLTYAYNYEQVNATDLTPDEVAALAYQQYLAWLDSTCGSGGAVPTVPDLDTPLYRQNPTTGRWEYINNGVWTEPTGDNAIPDPAPRPEPTDPEKRCGAASNAANALRELYAAVLGAYNETLEPAVNQANIAFQVSTVIGSWFGPISASFLALSDFAWSTFTILLTEVTTDDWSDAFQEELVCILNKASEVVDGAVHFDWFTVNSNLVGILLPIIDEYVRVRWQVYYLLQTIGSQGLDLAGAATAVEGDCVTCDTWCVNLTPEELGVTVVRGFMNAAGEIEAGSGIEAYGTLDVDTSQCVITRVGIEYYAPGGSTATMLVSASPSNGPLYQVRVVGGGLPSVWISDDNVAWYSNSDSTHLEFYNAGNLADKVQRCIIMGTGINPFGIGSNC